MKACGILTRRRDFSKHFLQLHRRKHEGTPVIGVHVFHYLLQSSGVEVWKKTFDKEKLPPNLSQGSSGQGL
jgi:hypothetical protein